ncbi:MunI family type II restriction endonuclease [Candidatus Woesearchaeota archaeon]|nr:MunI family type II restriction endonuclease [Candidatus Woesearchaeota archaeon]
MGSKDLRKRDTWQDYSGSNAGVAEKSFYEVFKELFEGSSFRIRKKPQEFKNIYLDVKLDKDVLKQIYNVPKEKIKKHGIVPDYAIDNLDTKKTIYIEVKRQDGWVERKQRKAGRGNAHERSCKFFTPGLLEKLRKKGKIGKKHLPFWVVFQGDITRDPCRVREVTLWYGKHSAHFFMWRNQKNIPPLIDHFNKHIKQLLL